ncbi:MAG: hypothetical protein KIT09_23375 [Bryobacteraceae bacterium]|nr:hypothetical protein [Bryobacteraceae bacterium]
MRTKLGAIVIALAGLTAQAQPVRISAWYWLNTAPKNEWERDFRKMQDLGFTDVVLCWGLDAAAFGLRIRDTKDAMEYARRAKLGAYMVFWHPTHNSLERKPEFQQVDAAGKLRFAFDVFNPKWRQTQWKEYLQRVAKAYKDEPAMAGYVFDDSFGIGPIGSFGGKGGPREQEIISYGEFERKAFGEDPPRKKSDPRWEKWVQARAGWWEDWARDTVAYIREIDPNPKHEIYLEDEAHVLEAAKRDSVGLEFGRLAKHFDVVAAYTATSWEGPDSGAKVAQTTRDVIRKTRELLGADKKLIYTFWVANLVEERNPGPARYPTVEQIRLIADAALEAGIRHLDMYGYRIGEYLVKEEDWPSARPGTGPTYPLTGQFPQKFLWDRPELHDGLRAYLRGLNAPKK